MKRGKPGRPSWRNERDTSRQILKSFPTSREWVRRAKLRAEIIKAGKSARILDRHLKKLLSYGVIERKVDTSTYPPSVYYRLAAPKPFAVLNEVSPFAFCDDFLPRLWDDAKDCIQKFAEIKNKKLRARMFEIFLETRLDYLKRELAFILGDTLIKRADKDAGVFIDRMSDYYITPEIYDLGKICRAHADIAGEVLYRIKDRYLNDQKDLENLIGRLLKGTYASPKPRDIGEIVEDWTKLKKFYGVPKRKVKQQKGGEKS